MASPLPPETLTSNYVSLPLWLLSHSNPFLVNIHALPGLPLSTSITLFLSHKKTWAMPKTKEKGMGNGGETGILVLFHLRTASRNGGKTAPVNYIITAASRERTGIQVAIVFVGMLLERQSSRPCLLCLSLHLPHKPLQGRLLLLMSAPCICVWGGGAGGQRGNRKEGKGLRKGLSCTKRRTGKLFKIILCIIITTVSCHC